MPKSKNKCVTFIPKANGFRALPGDNYRRCEKLQSASSEELHAFYELNENVKHKIKSDSANIIKASQSNVNVKNNATYELVMVCLGLLEKALRQSNNAKVQSLRKIKALAEEEKKSTTDMYEEMIYVVAIDIVSNTLKEK